ncbi:MAG: hypothetical protein IPL36_02055 [Nigerium sp.]|nr:hypothetical protein [Nigerium sp.]
MNALRPFGMQIWDVPGLVLCEDIVSDLDLPLVTTARVAGWGVRGSDLVGARPGAARRLYVVDSISVSDGVGRPLVSGAAVEIEKGAIVPEGIDAVLPAAQGALGSDGYVEIETEVRLYQNLRLAGSELADGTPLLRAGELLTPRSVGGPRRSGPRQGAGPAASARGRVHRRRTAGCAGHGADRATAAVRRRDRADHGRRARRRRDRLPAGHRRAVGRHRPADRGRSADPSRPDRGARRRRTRPRGCLGDRRGR